MGGQLGVIPNLVPSCDRCGKTTDVELLHDDGIGMICPACRIHPEAVHR